MELLRYIPTAVIRNFMKRKPFLVMCLVTIILLGVFQSNLKTDREKIKRIVDGREDIHDEVNNKMEVRVGATGEITRDDSRKLQSVDKVKKRNADQVNRIGKDNRLLFETHQNKEDALDRGAMGIRERDREKQNKGRKSQDSDYMYQADKTKYDQNDKPNDREIQDQKKEVIQYTDNQNPDGNREKHADDEDESMKQDMELQSKGKDKQMDNSKQANGNEKSVRFDNVDKNSKDISNQKLNKDTVANLISDGNEKDEETEKMVNQLFKLLSKLDKNDLDKVLDELQSNSPKDDDETPFDPSLYPQHINIDNILDAYSNNGIMPKNQINEWKYTAVINPLNKCENNSTDIFVLFMVKTSPQNYKRRKTLRRTWADKKRFPNIRTVFSIGIPQDTATMKALKREYIRYRDILVMDYMDTYDNLTLKTISGINWAVTYCKMAQFVVSVDDDMYVATDLLIKHLMSLTTKEADRLYLGHQYTNTRPIRYAEEDTWEKKWEISKDEYAFSTYPNYIFGGFIIMSKKTVMEMSLVIPYTKMIRMEDVYLGIVASRLGIESTHTDLVDKYITYSNTERFKTLIASHYYSTSHMLTKAWECHLSIVERNVEKAVFCLYLKTELVKLKDTVVNILEWVDLSDNALKV